MGTEYTSKLMNYDEKIDEIVTSVSGNKNLGEVTKIVVGGRANLSVKIDDNSDPKAIAEWAVKAVNDVFKYWPYSNFTIYIRREVLYRTKDFARMTYFTSNQFCLGAYETLKSLLFTTDDTDTRERMIWSMVSDIVIPVWWLYGQYANDIEFKEKLTDNDRNVFENKIMDEKWRQDLMSRKTQESL